jgi:tetratricopeptide (TPR) repeat protein
MVLIIAFYITAFRLQSSAVQPAPSTDWPIAMAESKIARASEFVQRLSKAQLEPLSLPSESLVPDAAPKAASPQSNTPNTSLRRSHLPSPEVRARLHEYALRLRAERDEMLGLISAGKLVEARKRLETALFTQPTEVNPDFYSVPLMDMEISQGDFLSVYKIAAGFIQNGRASQDILLRGSLAAATLGEVYPGQRDFLIRNILGRDPNSESAKGLCLAGDSPEVVAALSHILIGSELLSQGEYGPAAAHYEAALVTDPRNPVISYGLGQCYNMTYRYSLGLKVLREGLPKSGTGFVHDYLMDEIRICTKNLRAVGDGHPAPSYIYYPPGQKPSSGQIHP